MSGAGKGIGGHQSAAVKTDIWLTPPEVIAALGGADSFDLDPASAVDQFFPTAKQQLTITDDGMAQSWFGRTWLNAPYSEIARWLKKMAMHGKGISLLFARTETDTFHRTIWEGADALLFFEGRLHFHVNEDTWFPRPKGDPIFVPRGGRAPANAGGPSVLAAYGEDDCDVLAECGIPGAFVPLRLRALTFGFTEIGSWVDEVRKIMERADRPMTTAQLYKALADSPKAKRNNSWKAKIRQTLQRGPFEPKGDGLWELDLN